MTVGRKPFPRYEDAPRALRTMDGHCGLLAAWTVATHFHKRVSSATLIRQCGHTRRHGVFTIGLACALADIGLAVDFHTDPDPDPKPLERHLYPGAVRRGVQVLPAASVSMLLTTIGDGCIPIVSYDTAEGVGHFSPLLGVERGRLLLPHSAQGIMSRRAFEHAWRAPGICRQSIVVRAV